MTIDLDKDELAKAIRIEARRKALIFAGFDPDNLPKLSKKKKKSKTR